VRLQTLLKRTKVQPSIDEQTSLSQGLHGSGKKQAKLQDCFEIVNYWAENGANL